MPGAWRKPAQPAAGAVADAGPGDRDGEIVLPVPVPPTRTQLR